MTSTLSIPPPSLIKTLGQPTTNLWTGIGSTPAISGTVVTIGGGNSAYYGLSTLNGSQLWRDPLGVGPSGFAWASPLITREQSHVRRASLKL